MGTGLAVSPLTVEIECPRCAQPHLAETLDRGDEVEWTVACGAVQASMGAPRAWLHAAEAEILLAVRHQLTLRLDLPTPRELAAGTGTTPLVPGGQADASAASTPPSGIASVPEPASARVGSRPAPAVPRGLGALVLALKLPSGSKVEVEGDCWIFRSPDGVEIRLREPFDDPAAVAAAIQASRKRT